MDGYNFTERVRKVLALAREAAIELHHEYVGTEHILLGLIREGGGVGYVIIEKIAPDPAQISEAITSIVKRGKAVDPGPNLPYTSRAKKVLELAMAEAREQQHSYVGTEHILLGMLREEKGIAAQVLVGHGVTISRARAEMAALLSSEGAPRPEERLPHVLTTDVVTRGRVPDVDPRSPWATLVRWYAAFNTRDLNLMGELWSRAGRTSLVDPIDGIVSGWADIAESYRRAFARPARVTIEVNDVSLSEAGIFASIVGRETWTVEREGKTVRVAVQTTRIVRHESDGWHALHHHASIADPEQLRAFREAMTDTA